MSDQVEITLSFKPILDGLQRFGTALEQRLQKVRDFNNSLAQGAAATEALLSQAATVLGIAAINKYIAKAAEEERAQKQLAAALAQSGQYSKNWLQELNDQAEALQRVTMFSDEDIMAAQRTLATYGVRGEKLKELTAATLDFAAAQGMSGQNAAELVAKTIGTSVNALSRYIGELDKSKPKVEGVIEAFGRFSNQARAAVVFPDLHEAGVGLEQIEKSIGRMAEGTFGTAIKSFVDGLKAGFDMLKQWGSAIQKLLPESDILQRTLQGMGSSLGWLIAIFLGLLAPLVALKGGIGALTMAFGANGGLYGALFLAGFALGNWLNQLKLGGATVGDWIATTMAMFMGWGAQVWGAIRKGWENISFTFKAYIPVVKVDVLEFLSWLADKFNNKLGEKLGFKIPTDGLKESLTAARTEAGKLYAEHEKNLAQITKETKESAAHWEDVASDVLATGMGAGTKTGRGSAEPKNVPGGVPDAMAAQKEEMAQTFLWQTQLLSAQLAGNQAEVDRLQHLIDERKLTKELQELGAGFGPAIKIRLTAEDLLRDKERARVNAEIQFSQQIGALEIKRANIEANRLLTTEEKQREVNALLVEENTLIDRKLAKDEAALKSGVTDQEKTRLMQEIEQLRKQLADNTRTQEGNRPLSIGEGLAAGANSFLDAIGNRAKIAADAVTGTLNSALQGTSDLLYNVASGSMTFAQAWGSATLAVGQQFLRMATDMVAKLIWKATVERGLIALTTALHIGGEARKTESTATGSGIRLGLIIKEALAAVYHGAVAAFSAMASIPYVGPILAFAAMAAALAGGISLVSKIGHAEGGLISGPGGPTDDSIFTRLSNGEFVARAAAVDRFGPDFFNALNAGVLDLAALPANVAGQISSPDAPGGSSAAVAGGGSSPQQVHIGVTALDVGSSWQQWAETRKGRRYILNMIRGTAQEV